MRAVSPLLTRTHSRTRSHTLLCRFSKRYTSPDFTGKPQPHTRTQRTHALERDFRLFPTFRACRPPACVRGHQHHRTAALLVRTAHCGQAPRHPPPESSTRSRPCTRRARTTLRIPAHHDHRRHRHHPTTNPLHSSPPRPPAAAHGHPALAPGRCSSCRSTRTVWLTRSAHCWGRGSGSHGGRRR